MMPVMEWVIKNINTGELAQVMVESKQEEDNTSFDNVKTIIFDSPEQAESFIKRSPEDFQSVAVISQVILYGPKISCKDAIKELYGEEEE